MNGIPLYYQLETLLRSKIMSKELKPGTHLPSESLLAKEYNVSRITVRQALSGLKEDGLIDRIRGKGTYVSQHIKSVDLSKLTGSIDDLKMWGMLSKTEILDFSFVKTDRDVTDLLGLNEGTKILRIEKLRYIKNNPFVYVINNLPPDVGKSILREQVATKPLLWILENELKLQLPELTEKIDAKIADSKIAQLFGVNLGTPFLNVEITIIDSNQRVVELMTALFRGDLFSYKISRKKSEF